MRTARGAVGRKPATFAMVVGALLASACGASTTSSSSGAAQSGSSNLAAAQAAVTKAEAPETAWLGPTSGPPAAKNKKIACIAQQLANDTLQQWCRGLADAAQALGWQEVTLDGMGTLSGQSSAILQALSGNINGIVLAGIDPSTQQSAINQAVQQGVQVVTLQGLTTPGPAPQDHVFAVVTQRGSEIGKITADKAIVDSNGTAQAVVIVDNVYEIARIKAGSMVSEIQGCSGCKLLEELNSPLAQTTTLFPSQMTSLVQKYPGKVYYMAITDFYFDYGVPALKAAGVAPTGTAVIVGTDGSPGAYQRIRDGQFEVATVPPPEHEQGWEAADELNRAFNNAPWSGYVPPVQLIDASNIGQLITAQGYYDPPNNYAQHYKSIWGVG
jgi:ribose transport system substrate-binding protein